MSCAAWLLVSAAGAAVVVALVGAALTGGSVEVNAWERSTAKQLDACGLFTASDAHTLLGPAAWGTRRDDGGTCSHLSRPPVTNTATAVAAARVMLSRLS